MRLGRGGWLGALLGLAVVGLLWSGWGANRGSGGSAGRAGAEAPLPTRALVPAALEASPRLDVPAGESRAPADVSAAPREGPSGLAWLAVEVVARESGASLPGVRLAVWDEQGPLRGVPAGVSRSKRKPTPLTDEEGKVELEVRAGQDLRLCTDGTGSTLVDETELRVPALEPGERRAVRFEVRARPDLRWFGRVVEGSSGAPLAGASVVWDKEWFGGAASAAVSAADGLLELAMASWERTRVQVVLAGYASVEVRLGSGHEVPERACHVPLVRTGSLRVVVRESGQPVPGAGLSLQHGFQKIVASASLFEGGRSRTSGTTTDASGEHSFESLPPWVELALEVTASGGKRRETLCLAPGERREIFVDLGEGCSVRGLALDADSAPLPELEVWCLSAAETRGRFAAPQRERAAVLTTTNELGRFVLEDVPPGEWWVGPAPEERTGGSLEPASRLSIAPGERERFVTLTCRPGLMICGRVLDAAGAPAHALVTASRPGASEDAFSEGDGSFVLGPLPSGEWSLRTGLTEAGAPGPSVTCSAGDQEVILHLVAGAVLSGVIRDEWGKAATDALAAVLRVGPAEDIWYSTDDSEGAFGFGGLAPGTYFVFAQAGARATLGGPFVLEAGERRDGVALVLQEGGELCVRAAGSETTQLRFGLLDQELWLPVPGGFGCHVLPTGAVRVQLARWGAPGGLEVLAQEEALVERGVVTWVELGRSSEGR